MMTPRERVLAVLPFVDAIVPGLALTQAGGRWGNWFNQELYGRPTDHWWGLEIDPEHPQPRVVERAASVLSSGGLIAYPTDSCYALGCRIGDVAAMTGAAAGEPTMRGFVGSVQEALDTPEPRIHDYGDEGNLHKVVSMTFGAVEEGFAAADEIFEDTIWYEGNTHLPMEQHASIAAVDPDGKLTIWSSTQVPHYLHRALSRALELPAAHIRVIACPNGGGFGGKTDPFNHEIVVAKAARILGRPVKIALTREEVFYCHRGRHPVLMKFRTGVKRDGSITAMPCGHSAGRSSCSVNGGRTSATTGVTT